MTCKVRKPSISDYDQINDLGRWFQENSFYEKCGWSDQKSLYWVKTGSTPGTATFMRVVEKDGEVIGFFLAHITEYFFSDKRLAQDLVMVFKPEHREGISKHIIRMLKEFFNWAEENGAHEICIGITSGIAGPGYKKLIERRGFKKVGTIMKKEV